MLTIVLGRFTEHTLREASGKRQATAAGMRTGNTAIPEGKEGSRRAQSSSGGTGGSPRALPRAAPHGSAILRSPFPAALLPHRPLCKSPANPARPLAPPAPLRNMQTRPRRAAQRLAVAPALSPEPRPPPVSSPEVWPLIGQDSRKAAPAAGFGGARGKRMKVRERGAGRRATPPSGARHARRGPITTRRVGGSSTLIGQSRAWEAWPSGRFWVGIKGRRGGRGALIEPELSCDPIILWVNERQGRAAGNGAGGGSREGCAGTQAPWNGVGRVPEAALGRPGKGGGPPGWFCVLRDRPAAGMGREWQVQSHFLPLRQVFLSRVLHIFLLNLLCRGRGGGAGTRFSPFAPISFCRNGGGGKRRAGGDAVSILPPWWAARGGAGA